VNTTGSIVRPATLDDFPAIAELLDFQLGKRSYEHRLRLWKWRFDMNPARTDEFQGFLVAERDGRIVGVQGLIPLRIKAGDLHLTASCSCDLAVEPAARTAGMTLKLRALCKDVSPFHLSTSANEPSNKVTLALGGREVSAGRRKFLKVLKIGGLLLRRWKRKSTLHGIAGGAIQTVLKPMDWILATWNSLRPRHQVPGGIVKDIKNFDERFSDFWEQLAKEHAILVMRDPAYLNWRYTEYPFPGIQSFELTRESKVLGFAVVHIGIDEDHLRFAALLELVGLKSEPRVLSHLLEEAIRRAAGAGAHYLIARASTAEQEVLMQRSGFRARDLHYSPVTYKNNSSVPAEMFANDRNWYLSLGDGDEYYYLRPELERNHDSERQGKDAFGKKESIQRPAVIILDGNDRSALAATRSLGAKGIKVIIGAETVKSLASSSKYCSKAFSYPSPASNPPEFLRAVLENAGRYADPVLFPMTDMTVNEILLNRGCFPENARIPFPDHHRYDALTDKEKLFRLAREIEIPMPETLFSSDFTSHDELILDAVKMGFPLVVKAAYSRARLPSGNYVSSSAKYANDPGELRTVLGQDPFDHARCLVQKKIQGPGVGIFLLARHGDVLASFAHRRIREKPPSGGVSVLCESIRPPAEALEAASRLISSNEFHGAAMVEFKWDAGENRPKLIEVNARFWGSLNLPIKAGVDFPFLLYQLALGEKIEAPAEYRIGLKSRWELGDLDILLIRLMRGSGHPSLAGTSVRKRDAIADFLFDFFRPSVVHEVCRFGDIGPFLFEAKRYVRNLGKS